MEAKLSPAFFSALLPCQALLHIHTHVRGLGTDMPLTGWTWLGVPPPPPPQRESSAAQFLESSTMQATIPGMNGGGFTTKDSM